MRNSSPIRAFFAQTEYGESRWWSWLSVIWLAIVTWFYGQLILSIPMAFAGWVTDPQSIAALMQSAAAKTPNPIEKLALISAIGLPVLAVSLFFVRNDLSPTKRSIATKTAAGLAVLSSISIIYMAIAGSDPQQMEIVNGWMAKSPWVYLLVLLTFPPLALGLWLGQRLIHRRTILSLHTAAKRYRWGRMGFAMISFWVIALITSLISDQAGWATMEFVFDPALFWAFLPITLVFIPMQSATEEILLRGYLNQGLGHYIKNPWVVFLITSASFAALHLGNPEVAEASKDGSIFLAISGYFFFGMFACILTYIDGGLETAIGMHAANNIFAASVVGYENSALPTPTIFRVPLNSNLDSISVLVMMTVLCGLMFITRKPLILGDPRLKSSATSDSAK